MSYIFFLLMWLIWFYDDLFIPQSMELFMEENYPFLVNKVKHKDAQKEWIRRILNSILVFMMSMVFLNKGYSLVLSILSFKIQYWVLIKQYQQLLDVAKDEFPFLLDKLSSLVQNYTVPVSLNKVIQDAPELFKDDLIILVNEIHEKGDSLEPYHHFARKFHQISELDSVMKSLYSISNVKENKEAILFNFCAMSNNKLIKKVQIANENKTDFFNLYSYGLYASMGVLLVGLFSTMNFFNI